MNGTLRTPFRIASIALLALGLAVNDAAFLGLPGSAAGAAIAPERSTAPSLVSDTQDCSIEVADRTGYEDCVMSSGASFEYIGDQNTTFGSTGSGIFDAFLRLEGSPTEEGYNTDGVAEFQTKAGSDFTRSIKLSEIPVIRDSPPAFEVFIDVNEGNGKGDSTISLNDLEIWFSTDPLITGYTGTGFTSDTGATKVYDYHGNLLMNDVNQGSGRGDVRIRIPTAGISIPANCAYGDASCGTYFVLYGKLGATSATYNTEGGFEEFAVKQYGQATLTLVKQVTNDNGGTAAAADWTLTATGLSTISGATGDAAITNAVVPGGTYALSESGPAGYTAGAWSCTAGTLVGSSLTLADGDSATCTIINDDIPPASATLTLVKHVTNDNGGTAAATDWTLTATGPSTISGATGAATITNAVVGTGTYTLSESGPTGYTAGAWSCTAGTLVGSSVTLAAGQNATCSITNDDNPPATATLTLVKHVTNDNGGTAAATDWTLTATGPSTISGATGSAAITAASVLVGTYALSESGPTGYTAGAWSCTAGTLVGSSVTLAAGQNATCSITNDDNPPAMATLTLVKVVSNTGGGTATTADFTLTATGPQTISGKSGDAAITNASVLAGTYTLSETSVTDYVADAWSCTGATVTGSTLTLGGDANATCTITNSYTASAATLTLVKEVINDNGGTAVATDWALSATGPSTISGATGSSSVTNVSVAPGSYTLGETGPDGYTGTWICTGATLNGNGLTLRKDDSVTCTVTNDDQPAHLTLTKTVSGGEASQDDFTLTATGPTTISGVSGSQGVTGAEVNAGVYVLSETSLTGYAPGAWSCDGGTLEGSSLTLALGESASCSITNTYSVARLTLVKTVTNDNGGTALPTAWTLTATGPTTISGATGSAAVTGATVLTGTYTLSESGPGGYTGGAWSCVTGEGQPVSGSSIVLALNDVATCTINNNDTPYVPLPGTLVVITYNDLNGNGTRDAGEPTVSSVVHTLSLGGAGMGTMVGDANGQATRGGLSAGTYTLVETVPTGWSATDPTGTTPTKTAIVVSGSTTTVLFGIRQVTIPPTTQGATITAAKYEDANRNKTKDAGEAALAGWMFTVRDAQGSIVGTLITDQSGRASVTNLPPGMYAISETPQSGWVSTDPGGATPTKVVTVAAGDSVVVSFGNAKVQLPSTSTAGGPGTNGMLPILLLGLALLCFTAQSWMTRARRGPASHL